MEMFFINISNHPSSIWSAKQINAAIQYGKIIDIAFPAVDAMASKEDLMNIADSVVEKVQVITQGNITSTIHVMGEMCLTYSLVKRLKSLGYRCVASTAQRNAIAYSDGSKTSIFDFVSFREYE